MFRIEVGFFIAFISDTGVYSHCFILRIQHRGETSSHSASSVCASRNRRIVPFAFFSNLSKYILSPPSTAQERGSARSAEAQAEQVMFQMAEVVVSRELFASGLERIQQFGVPPPLGKAAEYRHEAKDLLTSARAGGRRCADAGHDASLTSVPDQEDGRNWQAASAWHF